MKKNYYAISILLAIALIGTVLSNNALALRPAAYKVYALTGELLKQSSAGKIMKAIARNAERCLSTQFRLVDTGSTSRGTNLPDARFDIDYALLLEPDEAKRIYQNPYPFISGLSAELQGKGFNVISMKYGIENPLGKLIVCKIKRGDQPLLTVHITIGVNKEQVLYSDYYDKQIQQLEALGADMKQLKQDIILMKYLFRDVIQCYNYKKFRGGLSGIGIEQLVIQSGGAEDYGRRLTGVGSFEKAMKWLYDIGYDRVTQRIRPLGEVTQDNFIYNIQRQDNMLAHLNPTHWKRIVNAARKYVEMEIAVREYAGVETLISDKKDLNMLGYSLEDAIRLRDDANYAVEIADRFRFSDFTRWFTHSVADGLKAQGLVKDFSKGRIEIAGMKKGKYRFYLFFNTSDPRALKNSLINVGLDIIAEEYLVQNCRYDLNELRKASEPLRTIDASA